ncbi:MAG: uroporphyrinogen decarboxylase family protein [Planctomycetota bacterium]|jgi:uroporphyrinogen-III decarboxylase
MMTSKERFQTVLNGQIPDRLPVTLFIQDSGHFLNQLYPDIDPWDFETLQLKVIELQKQLGVDVFVRMLFCTDDSWHWMFGGVDIDHQTDTWQIETTEHAKDEKTVLKRSKITTPDGVLTQEISIHEGQKGTWMMACTEKPIKTPADLQIAMHYEPRMPADWPKRAAARISRIKQALGDDGILGTWSPHGPYNMISLLIDHSELYSLFLTDPGYYKQLMEFAIDRTVDYLRAIDAAGVDVHCIGGNVAGGFLGEKFFTEHILPFEKRYMDIVQENGTPGCYHNCGEIMNLLEAYKQLGVQWVEPFSPHPLGDADLAKAKQIVNGAYVMTGGIDQVNVLQKGTVDQVKTVTEAAIKTGKPGGKFILQSADFLEYGTPIENIEAYVNTAMQFADY